LCHDEKTSEIHASVNGILKTVYIERQKSTSSDLTSIACKVSTSYLAPILVNKNLSVESTESYKSHYRPGAHLYPIAQLYSEPTKMALNFVKTLFLSPEINPSNRKAKSIPVLNPFDQYGRVFFFSWLGFMVAFLSWYAFPPLVSSMTIARYHKCSRDITINNISLQLTVTIKQDLNMTQEDVANSNIIALLAT
jgi:hypothetical protein